MLLYHHYLHKGCENTVVQALRSQNIDTKVVTRYIGSVMLWSQSRVGAWRHGCLRHRGEG